MDGNEEEECNEVETLSHLDMNEAAGQPHLPRQLSSMALITNIKSRTEGKGVASP